MSHPNPTFDPENVYPEDYPDFERDEVMLVKEWFSKGWISQREHDRLVTYMF